MKMYLGNIPINFLNVTKTDVSTNDATLQASDLQSGITAYAKGKKVTGTGKSFEFANYGHLDTNLSRYVPTDINVIQVTSTEYPIKSNMDFETIKGGDFTNGQTVATVTVNGNEYDLIMSIQSNIMMISCDESVRLQIFYGKDNYS